MDLISSAHALMPHLYEVFARAGGGGSGGGDGDAGAMGVAGAAGYFVASYVTSRVRRQFSHGDLWGAAQVVSWVVAGIAALFVLIVGASVGSFVASYMVFWPFAGGLIAGTGGGLYGWWGKLKQSKLVSEGLRKAAASDSAWDEATIEEKAQRVFFDYQSDWSRGDVAALAAYTTPRYQAHAALMMEAIKQIRRRNDISDIDIRGVEIVDMHDDEDNTMDVVTVGFTASAHDQLIDTRGDRVLYTDSSEFTEYWVMRRDGNDWRLDEIRQATENALAASGTLQQFASSNAMYYSPDWGCLLLPVDGELFSGGRFGKSDINNHVIGTMNDAVIQIYTYNPDATTAGTDPYIVAQTAVPRDYGRIVVRRRSRFGRRVSGLLQVKTEWEVFNRKYDVYASSGEGATSFELLHPVFMEYLESLPLELSIEVVDNVVYISAKNNNINVADYEIMLEVLRRAHKEMKM